MKTTPTLPLALCLCFALLGCATAPSLPLMQKNEQVRARVEAMIGRLKAMESGA